MPRRSARIDHPVLLASLLADASPASLARLANVDAAAFAAIAEAEHVAPLASEALRRLDAENPHAREMRAVTARWVLREGAERAAMQAFLDAAAGVPMIFFKGASTAHTAYPEPWLRMKEDWDLLVEPAARREAEDALFRAGFALDRSLKPGRVRMRQQSYRKDVSGGQCIVDLHTRVVNPPALAERIAFGDLLPHAVPLPSLHPAARGLDDGAALVLACVHRLAHHSTEPRLSWDYDVLLLTRRMTTAAMGDAASLARRWAAEGFVAAEVARVCARFGAAVPAVIAPGLAALAAAG
nr:nucleotidyltransferase family protein [Acidobacteriota bacterium]